MGEMTVEEARAKLLAVIEEVEAAGFTVWGWDDESILVSGNYPFVQAFIEGTRERAEKRG